MGIVGAFFDGTAMPMIAGFAACGLIALVLTLATIRADRAVELQPAE